MDVQQYISSGVIEAYALGVASREEALELERLCEKYPEIKAAVEEAQLALEKYAQLHAVSLPPGTKEKIRAALPAAPAPAAGTAPVVTLRKTTGSVWKYVAAAAFVLLIASIALNIVLQNRYKAFESRLAALETAQNTLSAENKVYQDKLAQYNRDMKTLLDPAMKPVVLEGVPAHADSKAMVFWDTRSKAVYLSLNNLPAAPAGKQYQLWAIVDGKPVNAGVYDPKGQQLQQMKVIEKAQMFAITLEKAGGSPAPTMDQMFVAGKI